MSRHLCRGRGRIAARDESAHPSMDEQAVAADASHRRLDTYRVDPGCRVERCMGRAEPRARRCRRSARLCHRARGCAGRRYATLRRMRATTADREQSATYTYLICLAAWAIPGAGHLLLGRIQKGLTFLIALTLMFLCGLWLEGRLFPVEIRQPLVALAALADMGIGVAFFIARASGAGAGRVIALTYEYGNAFLIVAGLTNLLAVLGPYDLAQVRK